MTSDFQSGLPVNILRGIVPTATLWDGTIGYAYLDDGGVFADDTVNANDAAANDVPLMPAAPVLNDAFYFGEGFAVSVAFNSMKINLGTAGVGGTIAWEYYSTDGTWKALTVVDGTNGFTTAGAALYVTWAVPADMTHVAVNGQDRYWTRARVLTAFAPIPLATQIWIGTLTSLSNITDGDMSTVTGTGSKIMGAIGDYGILTFDLGVTKNIMIIGRFGIWSTVNQIYVGVDSSDDNINWRGGQNGAGAGYPEPRLTTVSSAAEKKQEGYVAYLNGRYFRLRFYVSGAATAYAKIYEVMAYELGV